MASKRKSPSRDFSPDNRSPKRVRLCLEEQNLPSNSGTENDEFENNYQAEPNQVVHGISETVNAILDQLEIFSTQESPRQFNVSLDPKVAEREERWNELKFIVMAKENFRQDPTKSSGHSITSGVLSNAQLKDVCNRYFNKNNGQESFMKRYRNGKHKVLEAFPNFPKHIKYAPKKTEVKQSTVQEREEEVVRNQRESIEPSGTDEVINLGNRISENHEDKLPHEAKQLLKIIKLQQHIWNIENGELRRYLESSWSISDDEHEPGVEIQTMDSFERPMGKVFIASEHLKSSQEYLDLRKHTIVERICLIGTPLAALQRYVLCISPVRLSRIPQYDFALITPSKDCNKIFASCKSIVWDFEATLDLYELATQLRDCHVQNMVINHWREKLQAPLSYEVGLMRLQNLYERFPADDPAIQFWTQALPEWLPWEEPGMEVEIIDDGLSPFFFVETRRLYEDDAAFHGIFYPCRHPGPGHDMCAHSGNVFTETDYTYTYEEFGAISKRLLVSEGWKEEEENLPTMVSSLQSDLYNEYLAVMYTNIEIS